MVDIVTRAGKGSLLTNAEIDANFTNLNTGKLELGLVDASATANRIPFFDGDKRLLLSSALSFNGTNFGIGTGSPEFNFHVVGSVDPVALALDGYGPGNPAFITRKALGTVEAPLPLTNNTALFTFGGRGHRATGWSPATNVSIVGRATEDWSNTATGARLEFGVTQNGTTSRLNRFILDHDGSAQFNANIASTSSLTGTLVVTGGVGVSGGLNAGGSITTLGSLGVGTGSPVAPFHLAYTSGAPAASLITSDAAVISAHNTAPGYAFVVASNDPSHRGVFKATRARGTLESPTAPSLNDDTFSLLGAIFDGVTTRATAAINMAVDGPVSNGVAPQRVSIWTGDSVTRIERLRVNGVGQVSLLSNIASTSSTTGTLVVTGGVGVSGNLNVGGTVAALTFSGAFSATGNISLNNNALTGVDRLLFNDPGVNEGLEWVGGSGWKLYEAPDNLSNAAGNLQFVTGSTRLMTLNTSGQLWSAGGFAGNAATASTLQTARNLKIGATSKSFNGSADVAWDLDEIEAPSVDGTGAFGNWDINILGTAPRWEKPRLITVGRTGKFVDGSQDVSWSTGEIGIPDGTITFRNRLINGAFDFWQRGVSFTSGGDYTADRWQHLLSGSGGTVTVSRSDTNLPNRALRNKLVFALSGANRTSVTAFGIRQLIEMANIFDSYGGGTWTASFWYRSNRTGVHGARFANDQGGGSSGGLQLSVPFTVANANVWQYVAVQFNMRALSVMPTAELNTVGGLFDVGITVGGFGPSTVNAGDYFEVTGVQLESGSFATPFERRPFGVEHHLCQRYFELVQFSAAIPSSASNANLVATATFAAVKRAVPTMALVANNYLYGQSGVAASSIYIVNTMGGVAYRSCSNSASQQQFSELASANSEL